MSFDSFLSGLKTKASEMKTGVLKYKNKDFLNAGRFQIPSATLG